jgi:hypothetical protein
VSGNPSKAPWVLLIVALLLPAGYLGIAHLSGGQWPVFGLPLGGDREQLRRLSLDFWEDIQFKDFQSAAAFHDPATQQEVDIPYLLERLFALKPEMLDIMNLEVVLTDIDSSGLRGRVKTRIKVKNLLNGDVKDREIMLYFSRASKEAPWYMDLESSLRQIKGEEGKTF